MRGRADYRNRHTRESGVSSTRRLLDSIAGVLEHWVARSKPGDDSCEYGAPHALSA
jgi:hypothetical protein